MTSRSELFHGTARDVAGAVVPVGRGNGSIHGSQGYRWKQRSDEHAFATERESEAWKYAEMAESGPRTPGSLGSNKPPTGRARVYTVGSAPDQTIGRYHPDHPDHGRIYGMEKWHEHVSKTGFPVTGRIDIKPGHQGTFPIDWRAHSTSPHSDVNHPYPDEVSDGHAGGSLRKTAMFNAFEGAGHYREGMPNDEGPNHRRAQELTRQQVPGQMELNLGPQFRSTP